MGKEKVVGAPKIKKTKTHKMEDLKLTQYNGLQSCRKMVKLWKLPK